MLMNHVTRKRRRQIELAKGLAVCLTWNHKRTGKIVQVGPEVSEIKFTGESRTQFFPNEQFQSIEEQAK